MLSVDAFSLTTEQQFEIVKQQQAVVQIAREELESLALEISRQLMIKNNIIKHLLKEL
jgi:hypothetical protein